MKYNITVTNTYIREVAKAKELKVNVTNTWTSPWDCLFFSQKAPHKTWLQGTAEADYNQGPFLAKS